MQEAKCIRNVYGRIDQSKQGRLHNPILSAGWRHEDVGSSISARIARIAFSNGGRSRSTICQAISKSTRNSPCTSTFRIPAMDLQSISGCLCLYPSSMRWVDSHIPAGSAESRLAACERRKLVLGTGQSLPVTFGYIPEYVQRMPAGISQGYGVAEHRLADERAQGTANHYLNVPP